MNELSGGHDKKRKRRTKAQVEQLERQIYQVVAEDHPVSIRHIFYRMTDPTLPESVEKTERGYNQVQNRIMLMRRSGSLPYGWITDATRMGYHINTFYSAGDFIQSMSGYYRGDLWQQSDHYVEIWVESRSLAGIVRGLCDELAVSLYPAGGFSSISLAHEAAIEINACTGNGQKPVEVIYIGDYDPAGVLIDQALEKELRRHLYEGTILNIHRIAITPEQIRKYKLPGKPRKESDRRVQYIHETVEAEAMPAKILRQLLRSKIESFLPSHALEVIKVAEASERYGLQVLARHVHKHGIDNVIENLG